MTKSYPKGTIRRIIKAHEPDHKLSKSADVLASNLLETKLTRDIPGLRIVYERVDEGGGHCCKRDGRCKDSRCACSSKYWRITSILFSLITENFEKVPGMMVVCVYMVTGICRLHGLVERLCIFNSVS
jgi:hypothetical protein